VGGVVLDGSFPTGYLIPHLEAILHEGTVLPGSEAVPKRRESDPRSAQKRRGTVGPGLLDLKRRMVRSRCRVG
jgi:hypothetical protein